MATRQISICSALSLLWAVLVFTSLGLAAPVAESSEKTSPGLLDLPMEDLMKVEIASTASLTRTQPRLVPAAVTTITREQIQGSGARSLYELLDIYVPNLQWMRQHWEADAMGLRGIIADRDDKYLLLVNGRVMNERTHFGALTEQDLVVLGDIHHIDIVRGPGSALYGPGAVSMVVNIVTLDASTFQGTEVVTKAGAVEEFAATEVRHGQRFSDGDGGIFLYAGVGDYTGASNDQAPQVYALDFPSKSMYAWWNPDWGDHWENMPPVGSLPADGLQAGDSTSQIGLARDGASARDLAPLKLHAQVTRGDWDLWARYTRGGKQMAWATGSLARDPWGWTDWGVGWDPDAQTVKPVTPSFYAYQQATGYIGYKRDLMEKLSLDAALSYDLVDFDRFTDNRVSDTYREDEYYGKAVLRWQPGERHKLAFGAEVSHQELGLKGLGWPDSAPHTYRFTNAGYTVMPRWATNLYSLLGEYQWNISDQWTTFAGARVDDHTYTDWMFSPRVSVVHTPTDKDTVKLIWSRSVRANFEEEMKAQYEAQATESRPEVLDSIELRYERQQTKALELATSVFVHYNLEVIAWNQPTFSTVVAGTQREYGIELEATYHTEKTRLQVSHGYTQLYDFDLAPGQSTYLTSKPYGYGNDLANWSNHITKLAVQHRLDCQWTFDGSLRIYWGFPGMKDYYQYVTDTSSHARVEPGWERAYRGDYYLDLGLQYAARKNLTLGLTGYNLLGLFDLDLNKRNYIAGDADYRCHAAALALWAAYKFR